MNYKLEKFWNSVSSLFIVGFSIMNYKLEKFWNVLKGTVGIIQSINEL